MPTKYQHTCQQCGITYQGRKNSTFCSRRCAGISKAMNNVGHQFKPGHAPTNGFPKGYTPHNYRGFKITTSGYRAIKKADHPMADSHGYVLEHRLVMAEYLGRPLTKQEVVHHLDGDKLNNHISNLQLVGWKTHPWVIRVTCPHCGTAFAHGAVERSPDDR